MVNVIPVRVLQDNYAYIIPTSAPLCDPDLATCIVIDPGDASVVLRRANMMKLRITHILCTHHHWDHTQGNMEIIKHCVGCEIVGSKMDNVKGLSIALGHYNEMQIGTVKVRALLTQGHTNGHLSYYITDRVSGAVGCIFTGDTLFNGGCGKLFEGNAKQMANSMILLSQLPANTKVFCGHEYTRANLTFGLAMEPNNKQIAEKLTQVTSSKCTVPSTIRSETETNVFMRAALGLLPSSVASRAGCLNPDSPSDVLGCLRDAKDNFRPPPAGPEFMFPEPGEDSGTDKNAKESAKRDEDEKDRKAAEEKKKAAAQAAGSRPKAPRSMLPVNELDFELGTLIPGLNPNADGQEQENTN